MFTSKSRGVKREANLSEAEHASKKESPPPKIAEPDNTSPEAGQVLPALSEEASKTQMEGAADRSSALGGPSGPAEVKGDSIPEATGKYEPMAEGMTSPAGHSVVHDIPGAPVAASGPAAGLGNGGSPAEQDASEPSSSSSEAEVGPPATIGLEAATLLASLIGESNEQPPSQPKPGLQGEHLDVSKRSTDDQPAWYCLIPMAKADGKLSKVASSAG